MREFVVLGHEAPTAADVSLEDLPGAGRLDVLCRCVTSALLLSHGVRPDSRIHLVLDDAVTITVDGAEVRRLNPDERSTGALLRGALEEREAAIGHQPVEPSPGVELRQVGLETTLDALLADATLAMLHPEGDAVVDVDPPTNPAFVLSDHRPFTDADRDVLGDHCDRRLSLGPEALHADQAITVAHNWLDTDGYRSY